jgi:hypothetical protein
MAAVGQKDHDVNFDYEWTEEEKLYIGHVMWRYDIDDEVYAKPQDKWLEVVWDAVYERCKTISPPANDDIDFFRSLFQARPTIKIAAHALTFCQESIAIPEIIYCMFFAIYRGSADIVKTILMHPVIKKLDSIQTITWDYVTSDTSPVYDAPSRSLQIFLWGKDFSLKESAAAFLVMAQHPM